MTTNSAAAFDFYSRMFGWQKDMSVDMGSMGVYQTVKLGDTMIAGMMDKLPEMPDPSGPITSMSRRPRPGWSA